MAGEALGVMLVLALGGLVIPVALLFLAAMIEVIVVAWAAFRVGHDDLPPAMTRMTQRVARLLGLRIAPH